MSEPAAPTPTPSPSPAPRRDADLKVIVRPLPKVVFFWLTWLVSLGWGMSPGDPGAVLALSWLGVFFLNLLVISFDFNEERSLIAVLGTITVVLALLFFDALGAVSGWFLSLAPEMNRQFYWIMFGGFSVVFFFVWLVTRFNYWEFRPNEVVHRYGVFPKMKRYSTEDMRWDKTVPDILERLLLGTGTIILTTPHERHPVVLDHVMRISTVDDQIADILGVKKVVGREEKA